MHLLALVPKQAFNAFGGVQATIEEEARDRAEVIANSAAGELMNFMAIRPICFPPKPAISLRRSVRADGTLRSFA